jgi:hypothetical protein
MKTGFKPGELVRVAFRGRGELHMVLEPDERFGGSHWFPNYWRVINFKTGNRYTVPSGFLRQLKRDKQ